MLVSGEYLGHDCCADRSVFPPAYAGEDRWAHEGKPPDGGGFKCLDRTAKLMRAAMIAAFAGVSTSVRMHGSDGPAHRSLKDGGFFAAGEPPLAFLDEPWAKGKRLILLEPRLGECVSYGVSLG